VKVYIWNGLGRRANFPVGLFNDKVVAGKMRLFGEEKFSYKLKWITEQPQTVPR